jgi:hypothetical protein
MRLGLVLLLALGCFSLSASAAEPDKEGYTPLFNGKDLSGWVNVNGHPGTFFVRDEMIVTTGQPTGFLRTANQYENFILEFEWFHVKEKEPANSGLFVWGDPLPAVGTPYTRGIEVQVLVNMEKEGAYTSDGDVFAIHGATCKPDRPHPGGAMRCLPSEKRSKGGGQWNHYKVIGQDGTIKLHVNGKEVSGVSECKPRKGYLALESEGSECRFRNIKIKELPSTNPDRDVTADEAQGHASIFTGLDLAGWKAESAHEGHWKAGGGVLKADGKAEGAGVKLQTAANYNDFELLLDWRVPEKDGRNVFALAVRDDGKSLVALAIVPDGDVHVGEITEPRRSAKVTNLKPAGQWNRTLVNVKGNSITVSLNGKTAVTSELKSAPSAGAIGLIASGAPVEYRGLFVRELK